MDSPMIYEIRKPKQIDPTKTYPAIFVMHGMGSNEKNMLSLVEGLEEQFYIFSIRGHLSQPPGYAYFTIQGYGKPHREVFDEGVSKLSSFIEYASEEYPLDKERLYLLGFSQGAILSMTLALTLGNKIKGVIALNGYIPQFVKDEYSLKNVDQVSLFISHGEFDQVLPFGWGLASEEYFRGLGSNVTFNSYPEGHTISLSNLQDFTNWLVENSQKQ